MKAGRRPIKNLRWWLIGVVMIGTSLNYLTRSTLGVAAPTVLADLGIGEREYGWITGAFQLGIMLQPVAGYLLDTIGLRMGLAIFASAWAVITMAHGLATGWMSLMGLRAALGFAEGTAHPGGLKVVAEWFPARERGFASGIYNVGASFGSMLAPPLVAGAILWWNWRAAFVVVGILAGLWVVLWLFTYRSVETHQRLSEEERALIATGREAHLAVGPRRSIPTLLRQRNLWGIVLPRFLADPTWGTLTFWLPLYLVTARGFDLAQIAMFAWLPFVAADFGCMAGPAMAAWLRRRGVGLINARRGAFTIGALLMTCMIFVGSVESPYAAIALLSLGGFAHQMLSVTCITLATDLFPQNEIGTVAGIGGTFANLGVLLFSVAIGTLVTTIGYEPFFVALSMLDLLAAVVLWTVVKPPAVAPEPQGQDVAA
ncbi:MFS transporter [Sphingomonas qomolangmaensis]|uniref:MFS transporter n=1 Tax=Sphingomonas qomolangmaensis TaxID=2918765 RepID=A0ABY5L2Q0_9SPHN|nr:MFS transporter [Sphingomonas qomolangmaensis]UUL81208.1 MFS transporter [Sphingomonas qomolangmaensis]